jgi:hypothetical protein
VGIVSLGMNLRDVVAQWAVVIVAPSVSSLHKALIILQEGYVGIMSLWMNLRDVVARLAAVIVTPLLSPLAPVT